jgi:hypothetical protein
MVMSETSLKMDYPPFLLETMFTLFHPTLPFKPNIVVWFG